NGKIYGLLSSVAHSGVGLSALLPAELPTAERPARILARYGCEFDQRQAALVINITAALLHGFLVHFFTFFPTGTPSEDLIVERNVLVSVLTQFVNWMLKGRLLGSPKRHGHQPTRNLLAGFIACQCGATLEAVKGRYVCSGRRRKGPSVCASEFSFAVEGI